MDLKYKKCIFLVYANGVKEHYLWDLTTRKWSDELEPWENDFRSDFLGLNLIGGDGNRLFRRRRTRIVHEEKTNGGSEEEEGFVTRFVLI